MSKLEKGSDIISSESFIINHNFNKEIENNKEDDKGIDKPMKKNINRSVAILEEKK